ncbi:hypothetical protein HBI76_020100 [Parastagonospora nodorum]|nr:hypothetical protein HBI76_020100 [Parastagonospora nodorum]
MRLSDGLRTKWTSLRSKASTRDTLCDIHIGPDSGHHVPSKTCSGHPSGVANRLQRREETQPDSQPPHGLCNGCEWLYFHSHETVKLYSLRYSDVWSGLQWEEEMRPHACQLCRFRKDILLTWLRHVYRYVPLRASTTGSNTAWRNDQQPDYEDIYFIKAGPHKSSLLTVKTIAAAIAEPHMKQLSIETANLPLARAWYQHCHDHHHTCRTSQTAPIPYLRLIDCMSGQICEAISGHSYVALSYVWGTSATISPLISNSGTPTYPNTIKDAIKVAINLGVPYLWVDRYCIDQDNEEEKHSLISNMNRIYSGAEITIIAAAGPDPHYGLPGVSVTQRKGFDITTLDCGSLIRYPDPSDELAGYPWTTRGWTYQEMLLSRRRLVFTDSQMVFQCCEQDFREVIGSPAARYTYPNTTSQATAASKVAAHGCIRELFHSSRPDSIFPESGVGSIPDDIYTRIEEYSTRTLSYPQDVLNAFNVIFSQFESEDNGRDHVDQLYGHHFWGVPIFRYDGENPMCEAVCSLVAGLTWRTGSPNFYERDSVSRPGEWPSWSWTAIMGDSILFGATNLEDVILHEPGALWATLRRRSGHIVEIEDFVEGHQDSMDYQPSIDLSTWVLSGGKLIHDQSGSVMFTHHSFLQSEKLVQIDAFLDVQGEDLEQDVTAAYLGLFERGSKPKPCYLLVIVTTSGALRRIGLGITSFSFAKHSRFSRIEKLTWLPGGVESNPFGGWKFETITLF